MAMTLDGSAGVTYPVVAGASSAVQASSAKVIQVVNVQTSTLASSIVAIPGDNTIPQNTEGTELFTLAITPTSATSKLLIQVNALCGNAAAQWPTLALFQDSTANALAAITSFQATAGIASPLSLSYFMTAGTTSSTTFKIRFGTQTTSAMYINGNGGGTRQFGGADITTMTIMEIAA